MRRRPGPTTVIAPSLADMHRGHALMRARRGARPAGVARQRPDRRSTRPMAQPATRRATCSAWRRCTRRTGCAAAGRAAPSRGAGSSSSRRWSTATSCSTLGEWRAMTPDRYEREFHLPAGHATSFAGGPLAALRNRQPRAHPLRDRRCAGSTSPARRRSPAPASGAPAAATRDVRAPDACRDSGR